MSAGSWDIDAIVRQVLQRLEQMAAASRGDTAPAAPAPSASRPDRHELRLTDRVVTLATVEGRLHGIQRVILDGTAVVTPSVRDLLKRQEIALLREEPATQGATPVFLEVVVAGADYKAGGLTTRLAAPVSTFTASITAAVARAATAARDPQRLTVLLTERPALALCLANRQRALRAAWAESVDLVREAKRAIGLNVLVIDPTAHADEALADLIREFLQGAPHACPSELR